MNALFLDIDGVLNSSGSKKLLFNIVDSELLANFKKIVDCLKAKIIIISSRRRYAFERESLKKCFSTVNIEITFLDADIIYKKRSNEILAYLNRNDFNKIVIVDDLDLGYTDSDLAEFFVQVNGVEGLSNLDCEKIIRILSS